MARTNCKHGFLWFVGFLPALPVCAFELWHPVTVYDREMVWRVDLPGVNVNKFAYTELFGDAVSEWNENSVLSMGWEAINLTDGCDKTSHRAGGLRYYAEPLAVRFHSLEGCTGGPDVPWAGYANVIPNHGGYLWNGSGWEPDPKFIYYDEIPDEPGLSDANLFMRMADEMRDGIWHEATFTITSQHEIGHAIGLGHGSVIASRMIGTSWSHLKLSEDDICGAAVLFRDFERCGSYLSAASTAERGSWAHFVGYGSNDAGFSASESLWLHDEIHVYGTIVFDPAHADCPGEIHMIAEFGGAFFARHEDGSWAPWDGGDLPAAIAFEELGWADDFAVIGRTDYERRDTDKFTEEDWDRYFAGLDHIYVNALTGDMLGLKDGDTISFWIAYSSEAEPGVYHHAARPIVVTWSAERPGESESGE